MLVPNVVRSADDFVSGAADMFFFAFGAPKVREVDATRRRHPRASRSTTSRHGCGAARSRRYGYLTDVAPGPVFIGVEKPMKVYTFDNMLFTNAKVPDDFVYKFDRDAGEQQGRPDRGAAGAARILRGSGSTRNTTSLPSGRAEILQGQEHRSQGDPVSEARQLGRQLRAEERICRRGGVRRPASRATSSRPTSSRPCWSPASCCWVLDVPRQVFNSRSIPSSC